MTDIGGIAANEVVKQNMTFTGVNQADWDERLINDVSSSLGGLSDSGRAEAKEYLSNYVHSNYVRDVNATSASSTFVNNSSVVGADASAIVAEIQRQTASQLQLGNEILGKLEARKSEFSGADLQKKFSDIFSTVKERMDRINVLVDDLISHPDLSQQQLMRIQYEVMEMSIVLDVASKVGDKGSQALQTLFRNQ